MSTPRWVVITGANGGLGRSLVHAFANAGWNVAAIGHQNSPVDLPAQTVGYSVELLDPTSVATLFETLHAEHGPAQVLIHNAGVTLDELVLHQSDTDWIRCVDTNLRGAFLCARAALGPMLRAREGHIIMIGSYASRGAAGQTAYAAAKAGLIGLATSLARETGSRNVRVNTIWPGVLPTAMTQNLPPKHLEAFAQDNLLGRLNDLEEVARFTVHIAETRNISGQIFQLDSRVSRWA